MKVIPVIMAGGAGTRLWPLSRDDRPKQFHNLSGRGTLMEETIRRLIPLSPEELIIVTAKKYEDLSREEIRKFKIPGTVLSEPRPRNTAAAILYAALYLKKIADESIMILLPADHHIKNNEEFARILKIAVAQAEGGALVTIGIKPTYPETGYGYIKAVDGGGTAREIDSFVEKPDLKKAREYFESGQYYWNSGIFVWKTSSIMEQFKALMPGHMASFGPMASLPAGDIASNEGGVWDIKKKIFDSLESISIDYGVMEHAKNRIVIPGDFGWTDLGSWKSIDEILPADAQGNRAPATDRAVFLNADNCSIFAEGRRVSIVGLSDIVVVEAGNEILVIHKDASQDVKKVVELLNK